MPDEVKKPAPGSFSKLMSPTPPAEPERKAVEKKPETSTQERVHARVRTRKRTEEETPAEERAEELTAASLEARIEEELKKSAIDKRHLSPFTFRFRAEELEQLDETVGKINKGAVQKISKNDVVRVALNWLLKDYAENKDKSMLVRVLKRT